MRAPAQAGWCAVLPRNRRGGVQTAGALRAHQAETWTTGHARKRRTNEKADRRRRFSITERNTVRRDRKRVGQRKRVTGLEDPAGRSVHQLTQYINNKYNK